MNKFQWITALLVVLFAAGALAQEASEGKKEMPPMAPPQPLNDAWSQWIIGEWEGTTTTNMGESKDWMKIEAGINGQFLIMHYRSKNTSMNPETLKKMQEMMKMTDEQMAEMMKQEYQGMGVTTVNPQTGESTGYWFDSYRDISQGSGKPEGGKSTMHWKSAMIEMDRTVEKVDQNTMRVTFTGKDVMGFEFKGTSEMHRKK